MTSRWGPAPGLVAILCALGVGTASAQEAATIEGRVQDAATARPLQGAIVTLRPQQGIPQSTRTDEMGRFSFSQVAGVTYSLGVQRLGYEPALRTIDASVAVAPIVVTMTRMQQLDTIRVRAARQAIYGAVGRAKDLQPLTHAYVQLLGASATNRIPVDSTGHFFIPVRSPGPYLVRATARDYEATSVSVIVPANDGAEVAMLLDTATATNHRLELAFAEFRDRMIRAGTFAAVVPRTELTRNAEADLLTALQLSPSFVKKNLRFGETACVFVDGRARVFQSLKSVDPADVEAVEVYSARDERSGTLQRMWPRNMPCAETGIGRRAPGTDVVYWVSIWRKQ
ncbi:MAG TPA: carboxypeptidase-like regulatory domain-containing protein [Gemmatimonadaceae bacterium]|nr:carboxypeptidase-like regulatory domain-containing protein [Gemmatimonadaceae bacterium]